MKKIILPLILSLPLYSAANEMSAGGAFGLWDYSDDEGSNESTTLEASFNYEINDNFDASVRVGVGVGDETSDYGNNTSLVRRAYVTSHIEAYLKPKYTKNDFEFYALLGFASVEMEAEIEDLSDGSIIKADDSTSGFAYGAGISYQVFDENSIFAEWRQLPDGSGYDLSSISLGLNIPL